MLRASEAKRLRISTPCLVVSTCYLDSRLTSDKLCCTPELTIARDWNNFFRYFSSHRRKYCRASHRNVRRTRCRICVASWIWVRTLSWRRLRFVLRRHKTVVGSSFPSICGVLSASTRTAAMALALGKIKTTRFPVSWPSSCSSTVK